MTATVPPIDQPYYGAPLPAAFTRFFRKYGVFSGRASRAEFWWWALIWVVVMTVLQSIERSVGGMSTTTTDTATNHSVFVNDGGPLGAVIGLISLGTLVPFLALAARRFHDANISGLFLLLLLIPGLGLLVVLILALQPPRPAGQRFDRYAQGPGGYGQPPYTGQTPSEGRAPQGYQPNPPGFEPPAGPPSA